MTAESTHDPLLEEIKAWSVHDYWKWFIRSEGWALLLANLFGGRFENDLIRIRFARRAYLKYPKIRQELIALSHAY